MSKMLKFDQSAQRAILNGVKTLAKAVIVTLGPKGRNVVMRREGGLPLSTKDGVTVAKEIQLKDKFENMGAQVVKEASSKTCDAAGDGTTTAIVLASSIYELGLKSVVGGINPMSIKKGIDAGVKLLLEELKKGAKAIASREEIGYVATISANNDPEIGKMVLEAIDEVGSDGSITLGEAGGRESVLEVVKGMQFDRGYLSPYLVTHSEDMSVQFDSPYIFVTDQKISSVNQVVPILEAAKEKGGRAILIIAEDVAEEALATLVVNKLKAGLNVCAVKAPGFGQSRKETLADIAILTGAALISNELGLSLSDVKPEHFGSAKSVKVTKEMTTLLDGSGSHAAIEKRALEIRALLDHATSNYDKEKLELRLAKISGGVAIIKVGAGTESALKEKKARVEEALHATKAAIREGIVPGGGVALIRASSCLDTLLLPEEEQVGVRILKEACLSPAIAIANNCGKQGNMVAEKIREGSGSFGYNGLTDEFEDLLRAGVVDPVLVTKSALLNGASIASVLLTVSAMVTSSDDEALRQANPQGFPHQ